MTAKRIKNPRLFCCATLVGLILWGSYSHHLHAQEDVRAVPAVRPPSRVPSTPAHPTQDAALEEGLDASLMGDGFALSGHSYRLSGVAYRQVVGSPPRADGNIELSAVVVQSVRSPSSDRWSSLFSQGNLVQAHLDRQGRFDLSIPIANDAHLRPQHWLLIRLQSSARGSSAPISRILDPIPLQANPPHQLSVQLDRVRYQAGETVRAMVRAQDAASGAVAPNTAVSAALSLNGTAASRICEQSGETSLSGVFAFDCPLPANARAGDYTVAIRAASATAAQAEFSIQERTRERAVLISELSTSRAAVGEETQVRVTFRDNTGSPIAGARVGFRDATPHANSTAETLRTDARGEAVLSWRAPYVLNDDEQIISRVVFAEHPAYGALENSVAMRVSRADFDASVAAEFGALLLDAENRVYFRVTRAGSDEALANTALEVRTANARFPLRTDARGIAVWSLRPSRFDVVRLQGQGVHALNFTLRVGDRTQNRRSFSLPTDTSGTVALRPRSIARRNGANIVFDVIRSPRAIGRPLLVQMEDARGIFASVFLAEAAREISLPASARSGPTLQVHVASLGSASDRVDPTQGVQGLVSTRMSTAIFVLPSDASALSLRVPTDPVPIGQSTQVELQGAPNSFAALLVRDEATMAEEIPFAWRSLAESWEDAVLAASQSDAALESDAFLRCVAAAATPMPTPGLRMPKTFGEAWESNDSVMHTRGVLRDANLNYETHVRQQAGQIMVRLEGILEANTTNLDAWTQQGSGGAAASRTTFKADAVDRMLAQQLISPEQANLPSGMRISPAWLAHFDPSFSFDAVAARITRRRVLSLLALLIALEDSDSAILRREVPERWLQALVQHQLTSDESILDGWGRPFALRRLGAEGRSRASRFAFSHLARGFVLVSSGADGRFETNDDFFDPTQRLAPQAGFYAHASDENAFLEQVAALNLTEATLQRMMAALERRNAEEAEEERGELVAANESELSDSMEAAQAAPMVVGTLRGGAPGYGTGSGSGGSSMRRSAVDRDADGIQDQQDRMQAFGSVLRREFPATVLFARDLLLNANGLAQVPVQTGGALTTYRVEAVSWTASGFTTSKRAMFTTDRSAVVEVQEIAQVTLGEELQIAVRLENRLSSPLTVRLLSQMSGDGLLEMQLPGEIQLAPHEQKRILLPVRAAREGRVSWRLGLGRLGLEGTADHAALDARELNVEVRPQALRYSRNSTMWVPANQSQSMQASPGASILAVDMQASLASSSVFWLMGEDIEPLWTGFVGASIVSSNASTSHQEIDAASRQAAWNVLSAEGAFYLNEKVATALSVLACSVDRLDDVLVPPGGNTIVLSRLRASGDVLRTLSLLRPAVLCAQRRAPTSLFATSLRSTVSGLRQSAIAQVAEDAGVLSLVLGRLALATVNLAADEQESVQASGSAPSIGISAGPKPGLAASDLILGVGPMLEELDRRIEREIARANTLPPQAWIDDDASDLDQRLLLTAAHLLVRRMPRDGSAQTSRSLRALSGDDLPFAISLQQEIAHALRDARNDIPITVWPTPREGFEPYRDPFALALAAVALHQPQTLRVGDEARIAFEDLASETNRSEDQRRLFTRLFFPSSPALNHLNYSIRDAALAAGGGAMFLCEVRSSEQLPWSHVDHSGSAQSSAPLALAWEGEAGILGERANLVLSVTAQTSTPLVGSELWVTLPSGAEMDAVARALVEAQHVHAFVDENRILHLQLPRTIPGQTLRIPLTFRSGVAGSLQGLGVAFLPQALSRGTVSTNMGTPRILQLPRTLQIAVRGEQ